MASMLKLLHNRLTFYLIERVCVCVCKCECEQILCRHIIQYLLVLTHGLAHSLLKSCHDIRERERVHACSMDRSCRSM